jgi:hypothetical protein
MASGTLGVVDSRRSRLYRLFISVVFAVFGIWELAHAGYLMGAFWVVASVAWSLTVAFNWPRPHDAPEADT